MQQLSRLVLTLIPVPWHSCVDNTVYLSITFCMHISMQVWNHACTFNYVHACMPLITYICCTEGVDTMAHSTASVLYTHSEAIPEQPVDEELKIVMQQIAEKNASILAPHGKEFNNRWSLEFFPNENTCTLCRTPLGALKHIPGSNSSTFLLTRVKMLPSKGMD